MRNFIIRDDDGKVAANEIFWTNVIGTVTVFLILILILLSLVFVINLESFLWRWMR